MDVIKKTIYRAVTTSGLTDNHYIIIPDLSAEYHMKFGLTHDAIDMGFFDIKLGTIQNGSYDYGGYNYSVGVHNGGVSVVNIEPIGIGNLI